MEFDDKFNAPFEFEIILVGVLIDNEPSLRRRFDKYIPNFPHLAKDISSASVVEEAVTFCKLDEKWTNPLAEKNIVPVVDRILPSLYA